MDCFKVVFWTGLGGFFASLFGIFLAAGLWWPLSFSWEPSQDHYLIPPYPIPAYLDIGFGIIAIIVGIASIGLMIASGIKAILSYGESAR